MSAVMKAQIDWIPLSEGAVRPSQGKTLAVISGCTEPVFLTGTGVSSRSTAVQRSYLWITGERKTRRPPRKSKPPAQMGSGMTDGITLPQVPQQYHSEYGSSCRA